MNKPPIICLCGSTRFIEDYKSANLQFTLAGVIVLSIGCDTRTDTNIFTDKPRLEERAIKASLDVLHLAKIDLADAIYVVGDGYIGDSTEREIKYAEMRDKIVIHQKDTNIDEAVNLLHSYLNAYSF